MDRRDHTNSYRWWNEVSPDRRKVTLRDGFEEDLEEVEKKWYHIKWVVCTMCQGRGEYVNPSIDSHGLTREDFDEDPDFKEDYISGVYNMSCELCGGRAVEPEFDEDYNVDAKELIQARDKFLNMLQGWDAEEEMERSMGA
jgi:predicted methyltransferase